MADAFICIRGFVWKQQNKKRERNNKFIEYVGTLVET